MIRHLAPITANPYSLGQLSADAQGRFTNLLAVNTVAVNGADSLAVYFEDTHDPAPATVTAWQQFVASYTVTHPTPEETLATAATNQTGTLAQLAKDQATLAAWLTANPNGAVLTAAQTRVLARMLNNLFLLVGQIGTAPVTT